jgi:hypothetical protein
VRSCAVAGHQPIETCCLCCWVCGAAEASRSLPRPDSDPLSPPEQAQEESRSGRQCADYLFPPAAVMRRNNKGALTSHSYSRSSGERGLAYMVRRWSNRRSGVGELLLFPTSARRRPLPCPAPRRRPPLHPTCCFEHWHVALRRSAGVDRGVGKEGDVIIGGWSCCRLVDPSARGCVTAVEHGSEDILCAQCGAFYRFMDNAKYVRVPRATPSAARWR